MRTSKKINTVWTFPYRKKYYITHPWKWFSQFGRNIRSTYMRAKYGWTYSDVWNWDTWFAHTVPSMLRHMADHGSAYPGREPFDTPEKWHDWLHNIADMIETGTEEWQDKHNEYYEEYLEKFDEESRDLYWQRANELSEQGNRNIRYALGQIAEHYYDIWD